MSLTHRYEDAFKTIVRLQSGKQKGQTALQVQQSLLAVFDRVEREAARTYPESDLKDATFAVAAFADQVGRRAFGDRDARPGEPAVKGEWDRPPNVSLTLQLTKKGRDENSVSGAGPANAGPEFYRRLSRILLTTTDQAAEALEVYCLCLLLGFTGGQRGEQLNTTIQGALDELRRRIGNRPGLLINEPCLSEEIPTRHARTHLGALLCFVLAAFSLYAFFWINLNYGSGALSELTRMHSTKP